MSKTEPVRITVNVEATPRTEEFEVDRAEWEAMTPADRRAMLDDMVDVAISNAGGGGWYIADRDDEASTEG